MDLHRVEGKPDWSDVPPAKMNGWQRVAARTHGIITIGNFFSLLGLLSVPLGLWLVAGEAFYAAIMVLALGRICDVLDGWLADKTGTKSPLGEMLDASLDKLSTAAVLAGLVALGLASIGAVAVLISPHVVIAGVALLAYAKGRQFHPSLAGKFSMAAIWATILGSLLLHPLEGSAEHVVRFPVTAAFGIAVLLGLVALGGYVRDLRQPPDTTTPDHPGH